MIKIQKHNGFTLVELLAVIFIIGIISVVAIPIINKVSKQSSEELYQMQISNIEDGAKNWAASNIAILPEDTDNLITLTLGQLKIGGFVERDIKNPRTKKLFPNDMEITIKKTIAGYKYEVSEGTGGINNTLDENSPIIILNGETHQIIEINSEYIDQGIIARTPDETSIDEIDVKIKLHNEVVATVDVGKLVQYKVVYTVTYNGVTNSAIRTVTIKDTIPPVLTIPDNITLDVADVPSFNIMEGVSATDNSLKPPTITTSGTLSTIQGTYEITYTATDEGGNKTSQTRIIKVI